MSFSPFGIFDLYNQVQGYDANKAQQAITAGNYQNQLNQANNNLAITKEQAPLVPQQTAESFAARGVGQSSFGNGMGNNWAAGPGNQGPAAPTNQSYFTPSTGRFAGHPMNSIFLGGWQDSNPNAPAPTMSSSMVNGSGQGQGAGSGLQRARDLSASMVSNATSGQQAAANAVAGYQGVINHTRNQFYGQIAEDVLGTVAMLGMLA